MIFLQNLAVSFDAEPLFSQVNCQLTAGNRYALVGANGAGKTTLLQVLMGELDPSQGQVEKSGLLKVGFLKQDHYEYENLTLVETVIEGNRRLAEALAHKKSLLAMTDWDDSDAHKLADLESVIQEEHGYEAEAQAEKLLMGLGFAPEQHYQPMSSLSGGYKLRVLLAQLLFQKPDVMLLDEPTNHLDIATIGWLETFLKESFKGILVFISHDRQFLSSLSSHVLDIDYRTVSLYHSNFEQHLIEKQQRFELQEKTRLGQERDRQHLQQYIDRFGAKASKAKQAQSKQKQLNRIELTAVQASTRQAPYFRFTPYKTSGKRAVRVQNLSKSYQAEGTIKTVLNQVSFDLSRGDKCAIIGANGLGKSTLVKVMLEKLSPCEGESEWGSQVETAYVAQDTHEALTEPQSVLTFLRGAAKSATSQQVRNVLGQVLFQGDAVDKCVTSLSGGEAARLLLACMMLQGANVLCLDEPTNHLDMESVEALADALKETTATVIAVSHDRRFLKQFAKRLIVLKPEGVEVFLGTYDEYEARQQLIEQQSTKPAKVKVKVKVKVKDNVKVKKTSKGKDPQQTEKKASKGRIARLEQLIERLEKEKVTLEAKLALPDAYAEANQAKTLECQWRYQRVSMELEDCYSEWESLL